MNRCTGVLLMLYRNRVDITPIGIQMGKPLNPRPIHLTLIDVEESVTDRSESLKKNKRRSEFR